MKLFIRANSCYSWSHKKYSRKSREPVRGKVAREIREQLQRIATKSLDEHDRK